MKVTHVIIILLLAALAAACGSDSRVNRTMDQAEGLLNSRPDSALILLSRLNTDSLPTQRAIARHALLLSMALDKNYVDTTDFSILQPAIDYYADHGTADDRLRTAYYRGRIYQNRADYDSAMYAFIRGRDFIPIAHDSLTVANLLVAQAAIYSDLYDIDAYIENNLQANIIYHALGRKDYEFKGLLKLLVGATLRKDTILADSVMAVAEIMAAADEEFNRQLRSASVPYITTFKSDSIVRRFLSPDVMSIIIDPPHYLDVVRGLHRIGELDKAEILMKQIEQSELITDTLKYLATRYKLESALGKDREALITYNDFNNIITKIHLRLFTRNMMTAQQKADDEKEKLTALQAKNRIIYLSVICIIVLILVSGSFIFLHKLAKARRLVAEAESKTLRTEQEKLLREKEKIELEKANIQLQRDNEAIVTENLRLHNNELMEECEELRKSLEQREKLAPPVEKTIKERIEKLNSLIAYRITENDAYANSYKDWIEQLTKDKEAFMNSNRLAFQASHPGFIRYFEDHGLTEYEINYACLYAIGLRGKEVGAYINLRRHYMISSDVRRKLGIDEHATNLGIYIRKLLQQF